VNPKAFTVLHDEVIDINSIVVATQETHALAFTIPVQTRFQYQASASQFGKTRNLVVVVTSFVPGGVTGTTATGTIQLSSDLIFKDV